jgi:hypothetical protein
VTFAPVGSNPSTFTCSYQLNSTGEASQRVVESLPLDQVAPLSDNIITVTENAAPVPSVVFAHQRFALLDAHGAQSLKERLEQNQLFVTLTRHDDAPANADGSPAVRLLVFDCILSTISQRYPSISRPLSTPSRHVHSWRCPSY